MFPLWLKLVEIGSGLLNVKRFEWSVFNYGLNKLSKIVLKLKI